MAEEDTLRADLIGRTVDAMAEPMARFLTDALLHVIGGNHVGVVNRLLIRNGDVNKEPVSAITDLDLPGLLQLLDQCFFLPKDGHDPHEEGEWKRAFREFFGVAFNAPWNHPDVKRLQNIVAATRTVRNDHAHRSAGSGVGVNEAISDLSKLHDLIGGQLCKIASQNPNVFATETRFALDSLSDRIDQALAEATRSKQKTRGMWPIAVAIVTVVVLLVNVVPAWFEDEQPVHSEVLVLGHQKPNEEVLAELASYLRSNLDSGLVRIRLITRRGLKSSHLVLDDKTDLDERQLKDLFQGLDTLVTARESSDLLGVALSYMKVADNDGADVVLVTVGSTGRMDSQFAADWQAERWNYTPLSFQATWARLERAGRFPRPLYLLPRVSNWLDTMNFRSFELEGYPASVITVRSW